MNLYLVEDFVPLLVLTDDQQTFPKDLEFHSLFVFFFFLANNFVILLVVVLSGEGWTVDRKTTCLVVKSLALYMFTQQANKVRIEIA